VIVADTNLVAYLLIEGEKTELARSVWGHDAQWMMPALWRSEFLNVLATSTRARVLTSNEAHEIWHLALTLFSSHEVQTAGDAVLDVAAERLISAYDAQFVVAALELEVPLVTSDRRLLDACPDLAIAPERFHRR
jgi:predicted nucleic acid-binding protein